MKMFKKLLGVISAAVMTVSLFSGIYNASAVITGGFMRDHINLSDCEEIDGGTLQIRKGGKKEIPNSQEARVVQVEDESIATFEPTEIGPSYRVIGLKNGTTKVTLVPFSTDLDNPKKYVYTVEISDEFPKDLTLRKSEVSINYAYSLSIVDPYDESCNSVYYGNKYREHAKWTSDNESVVVVSKHGVMYPVAAGTANVTGTLNGVEYKCAVTVTEPFDEYYVQYEMPTLPNNDIDSSNYEVIDGGTIKVRKDGVKDIPHSSGAYEIIIEDESIAGIDYAEFDYVKEITSYKVIGRENGTTKVSVVPKGKEEKKYVYTVEVSDEFSKDLKLSDSKVTINPVKKNYSLHIIDPYDDGWRRYETSYYRTTGIYDDDAIWTSDNESVVKVLRDGELALKSAGTATVTALLDGIEYKCEFTLIGTIYDKGDVTKNGSVDIYDAITIAESLIGKVVFTEEEKKLADYNEDGSVNIYDAIGIAKSFMKK